MARLTIAQRNERSRQYAKMIRARKGGKTKSSTAYKANVAYLRTKNFEVMHHDVDTVTVPDQAGGILSLSTITQGDTDATRTGDKVRPLGWRVAMHLQKDNDLQFNVGVRIMLVQTLRTNGTSLTGPQIIDTANAGSVVRQFIMPKTWDQRKNYRVLFDRFYVLNSYAQTATSGTIDGILGNNKIIRVNISAKRLRPLQFTVGSNSIEYGELRLYSWSNQNAACTLDVSSRLVYSDM